MGRCSLTVALPILSASGVETLIIPTAILSTHTGGFENYTFHDLTDEIDPICEHWKSLDTTVDALYTGYLGSKEQQQQIARIFNDFSSGNPLLMVDPAMADQGKLYPAFDNAFALGMRDLVAQSTITVPNITEACLMLQKEYPATDYDQIWIEQTMRELAALGPAQVVLTGVSFEEGKLGAGAYDKAIDSFSYYFTEQIPGYYHGTGDIYSSALLGALLNEKDLAESIGIACEFTVGAIRRTAQAGTEPRFGVDFEHEIGHLIEMLGNK